MKRYLKYISICMSAIMTFTFCTMNLAFARHHNPPPPPRHYGYFDYDRMYYDYNYGHRYRYYHHRHHRGHWDSNDTWKVIGGIGLAVGLASIFSSSSSSKTYSEKLSSVLSNFDAEEMNVYRYIASAPRGTASLIYYDDENDLKVIKKVLNALYGDYIMLGTGRYNANLYVVGFYKMSKTYEHKNINGDYHQYVARELLQLLPRGAVRMPYEQKLFKGFCSVISTSYPNSYCYRDTDPNKMVIVKQ